MSRKATKKSNSEKLYTHLIGDDFSDYIILQNKKSGMVFYNPKSDSVFYTDRRKNYSNPAFELKRFIFNLDYKYITPYKKSSKKFILGEIGSINVLILKYKLRKLGIKKFSIKNCKIKYCHLHGFWSNRVAYILEIKDASDVAMFMLYFSSFFEYANEK